VEGREVFCGGDQLVSSRFQFVEDHRGAFGVKRLCRILAVSRSGFYRWLAGDRRGQLFSRLHRSPSSKPRQPD
jgi:hypothetical protein